jgi:hypothetical protein
MPPRKSTTAKGKQPQHQQQQPIASSSKVTLDALPPPNIPEGLTPDFKPNQRAKIPLLAEEREAFVHEVFLGLLAMVTLADDVANWVCA